ncbi:metallo-beta-lactamase [Zhongshania sp.]|jgi:glyoxylase-like metal-dependent hydrolase (beta-lactamase superfamily II)|uniref:metallo-beta-lactamase n=1 Tax=Zhongshania sp. TaxID=1971902 RepID=UPI002A7FD717|nr:metallo-beta-lactamase [Zhongshania sp.]
MRHIFVALLLALAVMSPSQIWASEELPTSKNKQLTYSVYLHISHKVVDGFGLVDSNGHVVLICSEAYIVDTPWSAQDTETVPQWIKPQGFTLKGVVSTHFHEERTAGIEYLNAKAIATYTPARTNKILQNAGKPLAANTFNTNNFWLVKAHIDVFYPGAGHAQDNVVVWLPEHKLLLK